MNLKMIVKRFLSPIQKMRFKVDSEGFLYIGKGCKIVNGKNIRTKNNVSIMPYSMIVSHGDGTVELGENVQIGMFSRVAAQNKVIIENNVFIGPHIFIADYNHEYRDINTPILNQGKLIKSTPHFSRGGG